MKILTELDCWKSPTHLPKPTNVSFINFFVSGVPAWDFSNNKICYVLIYDGRGERWVRDKAFTKEERMRLEEFGFVDTSPDAASILASPGPDDTVH